MWRRTLFSLMVAVGIASSTQAFAQTAYSSENREWEATGFAGYAFQRNFHFVTPVNGSPSETSRTVNVHWAPAWVVGARVTQNLGEHASADLEYSFADQDVTLTNLSPDIPSFHITQAVHDMSYNISYLPLPRSKRLRPYALGGAGAVLFWIPGFSSRDAKALNFNLRSSWEFLVNAGGGVRYLVRDQFALNLDVKDRISRLPSYGIPLSANVVDGVFQPGVSRHGILNNWQISFGFTYQWDEPD
jgi:outer membrane protein W